MKKQTAYIFAAFIVVLLILAIVIMWLTGGIGGDKPEATATPEVETSAPRQTQFVIPTATPRPTEAVPTETPTMTATPTPTPEAPSGTVIGSGSFDSSTGVGLNTHTAWTAAEQADGSVKLTLSVYVRSYTLEIGQRSIAISVNGATSGGMTRSFSVDSPNSQTDTLIRQRRLELQGPVQRPGSRRDLIVLNGSLETIFRGELTQLRIRFLRQPDRKLPAKPSQRNGQARSLRGCGANFALI